MWPTSSPPDVDDRFPRRRRRVANDFVAPTSSAASRLEQRRRDLPPHSVNTTSLWAFDGSTTCSATFSSLSTADIESNGAKEASSVSESLSASLSSLQTDVNAMNHGVIGSYATGKATTRMLWNRPEREEEEREEEALPSYLSYLQAPSLTGDAAAMTSASFRPVTTLGQIPNDEMEAKSKELTRALEKFILVQMQGQKPMSTSSTSSGVCHCERRVAELEKQVQNLLAAKKEETDSAVVKASTNALTDRVSTLEGRQGAFQSQLAQISKVLGVPAGKHGKSSQLKTLVHSLQEEINTKIQSAIVDIEAACVASAITRAEELFAQAAATALEESRRAEKTKQQICTNSDSVPAPGLPFSTLLNALAEEHEASLTKLSTHFDERLRVEGTQRIALQGRVQARLGELEDWLQQVEGELGSSHFKSAPCTSLDAMNDEIVRLETQFAKLEDSWTQQQEQVNELSAKLEKMAGFEELRGQLEQLSSVVTTLGESFDALASSTRADTHAVTRTTQGLKLIVEKLVRDTGSAEELLQQYVSTITHQVASVTRQYVSVRIRDNNRLIDATLRARVPDYVKVNESECFFLVRPEKGNGHNFGGQGIERHGFGLDESEVDGIGH